MTTIESELKANFQTFTTDWTKEIQANWHVLGRDKVFEASYRRISVLNAFRQYVLSRRLTKDSGAFMLEAHNDALASHVAASCGTWRSALQSLRSFLENSLCSLFFTDHPVEFRQWCCGDFRIGAAELIAYLTRHPQMIGLPGALNGLDAIKAEYATLSKAVHASAAGFRMTTGSTSLLLWSTDKSRLGMWSAREKKSLEGVFTLLAAFFRDDLVGTRNQTLRQALTFCMGKAKRKLFKEELHISIC